MKMLKVVRFLILNAILITTFSFVDFKADCKLLSKKCIEVYEFCDYVGKSKEICGDTLDIKKEYNFNDEIGSIRLGRETNVMIYKKPNFEEPNIFLHYDERCLKNKKVSSFQFSLRPEEVFNYKLKQGYNLWMDEWKLPKKSNGIVKFDQEGDEIGIIFSDIRENVKLANYYEIKISKEKSEILKRSRNKETQKKICTSTKGILHEKRINRFVISIGKQSHKINVSLNGKILLKCVDKELFKKIKWFSFSSLDGDSQIKNVKVKDFDIFTDSNEEIDEKDTKLDSSSDNFEEKNDENSFEVDELTPTEKRKKKISKIVKRMMKKIKFPVLKKHFKKEYNSKNKQATKIKAPHDSKHKNKNILKKPILKNSPRKITKYNVNNKKFKKIKYPMLRSSYYRRRIHQKKHKTIKVMRKIKKTVKKQQKKITQTKIIRPKTKKILKKGKNSVKISHPRSEKIKKIKYPMLRSVFIRPKKINRKKAKEIIVSNTKKVKSIKKIPKTKISNNNHKPINKKQNVISTEKKEVEPVIVKFEIPKPLEVEEKESVGIKYNSEVATETSIFDPSNQLEPKFIHEKKISNRGKISKFRCPFTWDKANHIPNKTKIIIHFNAYGSSDIGIALSDQFNTKSPSYQLIIGGENNSITYVKKFNKIICSSKAKINKTKEVNRYRIKIQKNLSSFTILENEKLILKCVDKNFEGNIKWLGFAILNIQAFYSKISIS